MDDNIDIKNLLKEITEEDKNIIINNLRKLILYDDSLNEKNEVEKDEEKESK